MNSKNQNISVKKGQQITVTIKKMGINGEGIGYYKRKIVFIPGALTDEIVVAQIVEAKAKFLTAKVLRIKKASKYRVEPVDKYDVGGIELENLSYDQQLIFKKNIILQSLEKFKPKGFRNYDVRDTLGMDNPYEYRNKAQFQVRTNKKGKLIAGLYRENSHSLVDLPKFATQMPLTMQVIRTVLNILEKYRISAYNEKQHQGLIRTLVVRETLKQNQAQLVFVTNGKLIPRVNDIINEIRYALPQVVSIMQNINTKRTSLIWGDDTFKLWGKEYLEENLGTVNFKLSARAFFQLNPYQTKVLYDQVKQALNLKPSESLVDAYCGVGTIGLYVADSVKELRGMDITPEAIEDARENAELNKRSNTTYEVGTASKWFAKWTNQGFIPDALVVDPPRLGLDEDLIKTILQYQPKKFVYVSCNPSTLARDLVELTKKYRVDYIQSVDMFPQTARCEAVVKLSLR